MLKALRLAVTPLRNLDLFKILIGMRRAFINICLFFQVMLVIRNSVERFITKTDWLLSSHSFSFAEHYDSSRLNFGALQVLNEDFIQPESGFGMHFHKEMEIITIVLEGEILHQDSLGNKGSIRPGEVQRMSAGTGITHSEVNPGKKQSHLLQIWVRPRIKNLRPSYEQKKYNLKKNAFTLLVSDEQGAGVVRIHQDATFLFGVFEKEKIIRRGISAKKGIFIFVINGELQIEEFKLHHGDSAEITDMGEVQIAIKKETKLLLIEVPV